MRSSRCRPRRVFSPNGDGRLDRARINFKLKQADDVTRRGGRRRRRRRAHARRRTEPRAGLHAAARACPGTAATTTAASCPTASTATRVTLRRPGPLDRRARRDPQGHHAAAPAGHRDRPRATRPAARSSCRAPTASPPTVLFRGAGPPQPRVLLSPHRPRAGAVRRDAPSRRRRATRWRWDGTLDGAARARRAPTSWRCESRDSAGNVGTACRWTAPACRALGYGARCPGRGGITVRRLGRPAARRAPVAAGRPADAHRRAPAALHRQPAPRRRPRRRRAGRYARARRAPAAVVIARPPARRASTCFRPRTRAPPQHARPARSSRRATTAQGARRAAVRSPGRAATRSTTTATASPTRSTAGVPRRAPRARPGRRRPARRGSPSSRRPLLAFLDRTRPPLRRDDRPRARGRRAAPLPGHRGVLLAGDTRWLTAALGRARCARFVRGGGKLASLGHRRRCAGRSTLDAERPAGAPTTAAQPTDLFGARLRRRRAAPAPTLDELPGRRSACSPAGRGRSPGSASYEPTDGRRRPGRAVAARGGSAGDARRAAPSSSPRASARAWSSAPGCPASRRRPGQRPRNTSALMAPHDGRSCPADRRRAARRAARARCPARAARAGAMLGALVLTPVLLLADIWDNSTRSRSLRDHPAVAAAARSRAGVVVAGALAVLFAPPSRRCFPLAAVATVPFRDPDRDRRLHGEPAGPALRRLGAGVLAYARAAAARPTDEPDGRRAPRRALEGCCAATVVLYAVQATYSDDFDHALRERRLLLRAVRAALRAAARGCAWTHARWRCSASACSSALGASCSSAIGFVEYATRTLLLNPKVIASNQFESYFRVNSLFFDPNIYGRFLAIVMLGVAAVVLWSAARARRPRRRRRCSRVLWAGLVLTLLAVELRARCSPALAVLAGAALARRWAVAVGGRRPPWSASRSWSLLRRACASTSATRSPPTRPRAAATTSIKGGVRPVRRPPAAGQGSGSFAREYRRAGARLAERAASASHTIPVTVAAEQGVVGLLALPGAARRSRCGVLFRGARGVPVRAAVAAAFVALLVHTMIYAAFLEDPLTWALLAVGTALAAAAAPGEARARRRGVASAHDDADDDLRAVVGERHVLTDPDLRAPYETDWTGASMVTRARWCGPADASEVAAVLAACRAPARRSCRRAATPASSAAACRAAARSCSASRRLDDIGDPRARDRPDRRRRRRDARRAAGGAARGRPRRGDRPRRARQRHASAASSPPTPAAYARCATARRARAWRAWRPCSATARWCAACPGC